MGKPERIWILRFEQKFSMGLPCECWEWNGYVVDGGYPYFFLGKGKVKSSRVSYELYRGEIPEHNSFHGMCILHKCDNRKCINPEHLFLGTHQDNMDDMVMKGRHVKGGLCGEKHHSAKLTRFKAARIREFVLCGVSVRDLANLYGVCCDTIRNVVKGKTWGKPCRVAGGVW